MNMSELKTIKFDKDYSKLTKAGFSTLRHPNEAERKKYVRGETYRVKSPSHDFKALCTGTDLVCLGYISDNFLIDDTDEPNRYEAVNALLRFYPNLTRCSQFFVVWFTQLEE